jgi:membrane-bound lytic murein transglycosylase A
VTGPGRSPRARGRGAALLLGAALLGAGLAGCAGRPVPPADPARALAPVWRFRLPDLRDDGDLASLRAAVEQSLAWLATQPADRPLLFGPRAVPAGEQAGALRRLLVRLADDPAPAALAAWVRREFEVWRAAGGETGEMLVTGYYEPVVDVADRPGPDHPAPVYARPADLVEAALGAFVPDLRGRGIAGRVEAGRLVPYWTRAEIEAGRLAGRGLELAWARDPVDVFVMEIQGSGTLRYPDGREVRVGYAAANGRRYRSIGRLLADEGRMDRAAVSLPAIRRWLREHPAEQARVLRHNEAVVFFRPLDGPPLGSLGVPVTPGRSVAVDARLFPPGALAFLRTRRPGPGPDGGVAWRPLARFVLSQDTGGAITGPGRVDLFWGRGPDAELAAGLMREPGALYFLVPRPAPAAPGRP